MAKRKNVAVKNTKPKAKKSKKEVPVTPRLSLKPRLTPLPSKKKKVNQNNASEKGLCFEDTSSQETCYSQDSCIERSCDEQRKDNSDTMSSSAAEENMNYDIENHRFQSSENDEEVEANSPSEIPSVPNKGKKGKVRKICQGLDWNDRERMDLALALQKHGFSDVKKLAEFVKTKNEIEVRQFLKLRRVEASYNDKKAKHSNDTKASKQGDRWNTLCRDYLALWPNVRKWRKLAYLQMLFYSRSRDYSKPVLKSLCQKFYEEESEPADPQIINVKLIYKYMTSCMSGEIPPQLPPKESALVLDLLREVRLMPIAYDFEEERKFLQDFKTATKFKPFQVKDEFKKRYRKEPEPEDMFPPNTVSVPEQVFLDLSRHKRLTQSFSPMVTPVWMLQKEQEILEKYDAESNVYVD